LTPGIPSPCIKMVHFLILRCRYNMYMNFFVFFSRFSASRPFESALPYQLSGCKYTHVIFLPQNVFRYFFQKKIN